MTAAEQTGPKMTDEQIAREDFRGHLYMTLRAMEVGTQPTSGVRVGHLTFLGTQAFDEICARFDPYPPLITALARMVEAYDSDDGLGPIPVIELARAALRKAGAL